MAGHPHPVPVTAPATLRWWTPVLAAAAFVLLLFAVAGSGRHSGQAAVPPVVELLGHIRALLPDALVPTA